MKNTINYLSKKFLLKTTFFISFLIIIFIFPNSSSAQTTNVSGTWTMTQKTEMGDFVSTLEFVQDGEKLTGTSSNEFLGSVDLEGTIQENVVKWKISMEFNGQTIESNIEGTIDEEGKMSGKVNTADFGESDFTAERKE